MLVSRRGFMKMGGVAVGSAALGLTLGGCSKGGNDTQAASDSGNNHVTLGYWGGTCEAPIYIGYENGYFKDAGLDPELLKITSDVAPLMASGDLDCFELTPDKFKPMEQGLECCIIDSLHKGCIQGAASPASGIKSVRDLEGKKVAATVGGIAQIQLSSEMVLAGLDPKKVEWLTYTSPQLEPAMNAGEIDAFAQYDPWADIAVSHGATRFYSNTFDANLKDYLCCFVGMSTKRLSADASIGEKLSQGFAKAAQFLTEHPDEAADIIVNGGYVPVSTDSGFTQQIMLQEIKNYTWISGDKDTIDKSFHEIWMQIYRAGAMEDAPSGDDALNKYIDDTLYNSMVKFQGR